MHWAQLGKDYLPTWLSWQHPHISCIQCRTQTSAEANYHPEATITITALTPGWLITSCPQLHCCLLTDYQCTNIPATHFLKCATPSISWESYGTEIQYRRPELAVVINRGKAYKGKGRKHSSHFHKKKKTKKFKIAFKEPLISYKAEEILLT